MTVIQVVTLQGWSGIMDACQGAHTVWVAIFFMLLVVTGPLFAMKLFLAIICNKLKQMQLQNKVHMQAESVKELRNHRLTRILQQWEEGVLCRCLYDWELILSMLAMVACRIYCFIHLPPFTPSPRFAHYSRTMESETWRQFRNLQVRRFFKTWDNARESKRQFVRLHTAGVGLAVVKEEEEESAKVLSLR